MLHIKDLNIFLAGHTLFPNLPRNLAESWQHWRGERRKVFGKILQISLTWQSRGRGPGTSCWWRSRGRWRGQWPPPAPAGRWTAGCTLCNKTNKQSRAHSAKRSRHSRLTTHTHDKLTLYHNFIHTTLIIFYLFSTLTILKGREMLFLAIIYI